MMMRQTPKKKSSKNVRGKGDVRGALLGVEAGGGHAVSSLLRVVLTFFPFVFFAVLATAIPCVLTVLTVLTVHPNPPHA